MEMTITQDMVDFYHRRTAKHINFVDQNLQRLKYAFSDLETDVIDRLGLDHDASKYSDCERDGYILITEKYKDDHKKYFSKNQEQLMADAWNHHKLKNRHHPEHHSNIEDMNKYDLAEMVADWAAISQEKNTSLKDWADQNIGKRFKFNKEQTKLIYKYLDVFSEVL